MIDFKKEKILARKGYKIIIGIDEAGRGALAGPITVGAIAILIPIFNFSFWSNSFIKKGEYLYRFKTKENQTVYKKINNKFSLTSIRDSKKLSEKQREQWYEVLTSHPGIYWAIASVGSKIIDKININKAANLAAKRVFKKLINKIFYLSWVSCSEKKSVKILKEPNLNLDNYWSRNDLKIFILLDGNLFFKTSVPKFCILNSQTIIKGDEKIWSIAAASIIAKVTRDRRMHRLAKVFPEYNLEIHKGYGTKLHYKKIKKYGLSEIHRRSFF